MFTEEEICIQGKKSFSELKVILQGERNLLTHTSVINRFCLGYLDTNMDILIIKIYKQS